MSLNKQKPGSLVQVRDKDKNGPSGKMRKGRKNPHSSNPQHRQSAP